MARKTVMTRIYPEDLPRLNTVRLFLQASRLEDLTNADAIKHMLDNTEGANLNTKPDDDAGKEA